MTTKRTIAVATAAALTFAACGSDDTATDPVDAPADAASTTAAPTSDSPTASDSASTTEPESTSPPGTDAPSDTTASAASLDEILAGQNETPIAFEIDVDATAQGTSITTALAGSLDPARALGQFTMTVNGGQNPGEIEIVLADNVVYMTGDAITTAFDVSTPWLSIDADEVANAPQVSVPGIDLANPTGGSNLVDLSAISVEEAGTSTAAGVDVTNYQVAVDPEASEEIFRSNGELVDGQLDFTLGVDGQQRFRTMTIEEAVTTQGPDGQAVDVDVALGFVVTDYGVTVDAQPPSSDEVTDITDQITQGT